jgi:hypothetical protein
MEKYVRCVNNNECKELEVGKVYKVLNMGEMYYTIKYKNDKEISRYKEKFEEVKPILDINLQRVNNIVIGTLNYVDDKFKEIEEIKLSTSINQRNIFLYDNSILLAKRGNGMSDTLHFNSAQEAQDYIDKFTMIIDDINMNQPETKYKINCDKLYSEEDMSKLKELGIDFTKVGE